MLRAYQATRPHERRRISRGLLSAQILKHLLVHRYKGKPPDSAGAAMCDINEQVDGARWASLMAQAAARRK